MNKAIKSCLSAFALLLPLCASATPHSGEYYWNTDPGIGRALKMAVTDVGADGIMQSTLDASGALPGVNVLGMRVFNGKWSPTLTQYVFVPIDPESINSAVCEYWWDKDPGMELGTKLTVETNGNGNITLDFNAESLTPGIHTLGFRTNINGMWSATVTRYVFVPQDPASITETVCEYWWDKDPGVGYCENTVSAPTSGTGAIDLNLKAEGLTPGMHLLGIRSSINGQWSTTYTAPVFVRDNVVAVIDAIEYFWGDDPGCGNGTPLDITAAETIDIDKLVLDFPAEEQEHYTLTIRAHSSIGGWGYCLVKVFTPVEATGATIDPAEYRFGYPNQEHQFTALPVPVTGWIDGFTWETSDPEIATVDADGVVTSVKEGECTITARMKNTEFYAESKVIVDNEDRYPLGDSNGSMDVTITDVATTAAYVLGTQIQKFIFRAADTTADEEISVADAVGTVNIIFGLPVANEEIRAKAKTDVAHAEISGFSLEADGTGLLTIDVDNILPLTAMQFDLHLPAGLDIAYANKGMRAAGHSIQWNRLEDGLFRVIMYSGANAPFSGNEGRVMELGLTADGLIENDPVARAYNVRVVECNALEHRLSDMEAETGTLSEVETIECDGLRIYVEERTLHIVSPDSRTLTMSTLEGIMRILEVQEGDNAYGIDMPGVYIVNGMKIIIY